MGYGTGFGVSAVARAAAIHAIVDPHATLIAQANVAPPYLANNFSNSENQLLQQGDFAPMRDRLNRAFESVARVVPDAKVAYAGGSLGAAVVGSAVGHAEEMVFESNGATIVDPANIALRGFARLGGCYIQDLAEMSMVGASNFNLDWWVSWLQLKRRKKAQIKAGKIAVNEAIYLAKALGKEQLKDDLVSSPEDVGIVHIWSKNSAISPDAANLSIAEAMQASGNHPLYQPVRITHPRSRHGVTVAFALQVAALERAMELTQGAVSL